MSYFPQFNVMSNMISVLTDLKQEHQKNKGLPLSSILGPNLLPYILLCRFKK